MIVVAISSPQYDAAAGELRLNATVLYMELEGMKIVHNYVAHATRCVSEPPQAFSIAG